MPVGRPLRLLIVEDDDSARQALNRLVKVLGIGRTSHKPCGRLASMRRKVSFSRRFNRSNSLTDAMCRHASGRRQPLGVEVVGLIGD